MAAARKALTAARRCASSGRAVSRNSAARSVLASSVAIVIGPTPPGTGVIHAARSLRRGESTSPQSLPSAPRLMPTSITMAPGLIQSPWTKFGLADGGDDDVAPAATSPGRSRVFEWQIVTVQRAISSSSAIGRPTMFDWPITTACLPTRSSPVSFSSVMQP